MVVVVVDVDVVVVVGRSTFWTRLAMGAFSGRKRLVLNTLEKLLLLLLPQLLVVVVVRDCWFEFKGAIIVLMICWRYLLLPFVE